MEPEMVARVAEYADILQIGARNVQNFPLLQAAGRNSKGKPVMLKRGLASTIEEWLLAAEYIVAAGNPNVILCERGVRSFDPLTRNLLDLACVPLLHELTHLPVIVDPSHGTGRRELIAPMSRAGIAAGADGLILEVHPDPNAALCDGKQSITPEQLQSIVHETHALASLMAGRFTIEQVA
jgi:3-deoxy-7-phosphoheptulonate synthase